MYSPDSPILDFYPKHFETDLNGKKQEWEAVVKIPFLDQARLLKAMRGARPFYSDSLNNQSCYFRTGPQVDGGRGEAEFYWRIHPVHLRSQ